MQEQTSPPEKGNLSEATNGSRNYTCKSCNLKTPKSLLEKVLSQPRQFKLPKGIEYRRKQLPEILKKQAPIKKVKILLYPKYQCGYFPVQYSHYSFIMWKIEAKKYNLNQPNWKGNNQARGRTFGRQNQKWLSSTLRRPLCYVIIMSESNNLITFRHNCWS